MIKTSFAELHVAVGRYGDPARPDQLPRPACTVMLVCGPPGAGKTSYVRQRMGERDTLIDLDEIAKEHGYGRDRPRDAVGMLLMDRNERLAALSVMPPAHVAWVVMTAPSSRLRAWWCSVLNVSTDNLILMVASRDDLIRRCAKDPERRGMLKQQIRWIDQWFERESENRPTALRGCDENGWPTDPMHFWNQ